MLHTKGVLVWVVPYRQSLRHVVVEARLQVPDDLVAGAGGSAGEGLRPAGTEASTSGALFEDRECALRGAKKVLIPLTTLCDECS